MILVTGATGSNGRELVKLLSGTGFPVRAMSRKRPDPSNSPLAGIDFVAADFDDPASLDHALEGVDRAFLVTNSTERVEAQQLTFVKAAKRAGVKHIVYLSQLHSAKDSPVRFLRYHAVVEAAIADAGIAFTHLRPNLYMQGLLGFRSTIAAGGQFFAPAGDAKVSIVDVRDVAAVAAKALTEDGHAGMTYDVTGPESLTHAEMATQLSAALGKTITFVNVPDAAMRGALMSFGFPAWQADGLIEDYAHYRRGEAAAVSTSVRDVTGHEPRKFSSFARDYRGSFMH